MKYNLQLHTKSLVNHHYFMVSEGRTCDRPHPSHRELITGYIQYIYLQQNIILISIVLVFSLLTFCKCSNQFSIFNIYIIMVLLQLYILDISSRGYPCIPDDCSSSTVWGWGVFSPQYSHFTVRPGYRWKHLQTVTGGQDVCVISPGHLTVLTHRHTPGCAAVCCCAAPAVATILVQYTGTEPPPSIRHW